MSVKIGVIVASTRPARAGRHIADWFMDQVSGSDGVIFDLIDLKEEDLPFLPEPKSAASGEYEKDSTKKWSEKINQYDGYVFVTAEYNNGPPAPLKNALDTLYHEWDRKPVAFVGYGGYGATRAVEQLVDSTAKIGMVPLSKTFVGVIKVWEALDSNNKVKPEFVMGNPEKMVENLKWWAETLKAAR